jgi:hypothetical protein
METTTGRAARPQVVLFGVALGWAVATWAAISLVTDVDEDSAALWIGVALTLAAPPVLLAAAAWVLLRARRGGSPSARLRASLLGFTGGALLLAALVTLSGAGAFLYPFNTDGSRAPVLGALAPAWYILGILELLAGLLLLAAGLVALVRARRS